MIFFSCRIPILLSIFHWTESFLVTHQCWLHSVGLTVCIAQSSSTFELSIFLSYIFYNFTFYIIRYLTHRRYYITDFTSSCNASHFIGRNDDTKSHYRRALSLYYTTENVSIAFSKSDTLTTFDTQRGLKKSSHEFGPTRPKLSY